MRFNEFKTRTDEIAPLAPIAAGVARVGAKMMGKGIGMAAKLGSKGAGMAAKAGAKLGKSAVVGAGNLAKKAVGTAKNIVVDKAVGAADKILQQKLLKPGQELAGGVIDKVTGSHVTIADPKNKQGPKSVYDKKSPVIKVALDQLAQDAQA
tara:strand:+ start:22 stop:474 length:453 start_codon:yes stop_codon:yes gene_type:complete